jgi:hypothetical protein
MTSKMHGISKQARLSLISLGKRPPSVGKGPWRARQTLSASVRWRWFSAFALTFALVLTTESVRWSTLLPDPHHAFQANFVRT